jgi:hypothetical protein
LQKKSSEIPFRTNFKNLNKAENYAKNYEQGYYEKKDANGKPVTVFVRNQPETSDLPIPDGSYSYTHIHNNNYIKTDEDGNETEIRTVKIPSPADLFALLSQIKMSAIASNITFQDTYGMMFSSEGIFALTPLSANFDTSVLALSQKDFRKEYEKKVTKVLKKDSLSSAQRKEALQKILLQLLKTYGLEGKVGLFEANQEATEPGQTLPNISWTQKSIGPNGELVETPC